MPVPILNSFHECIRVENRNFVTMFESKRLFSLVWIDKLGAKSDSICERVNNFNSIPFHICNHVPSLVCFQELVSCLDN